MSHPHQPPIEDNTAPYEAPKGLSRERGRRTIIAVFCVFLALPLAYLVYAVVMIIVRAIV